MSSLRSQHSLEGVEISMKRLFDIDPWKLKTTTLHKEDKRLQESLTSIGNGYMGQRGNFEEGYSADTHEGTYLAGVWYPDKTRVGWWKIGYPEYFGKVINAMNFIKVGIEVDGHPVDLATDNFSDFYLESDMKTGVLNRHYTWKSASEEVEIRFSFKRFLSIVDKEIAAIQISAEILKGNPAIKLTSALDNNVQNEDANYEEMFWEAVETSVEKPAYLTAKTVPNNFGIDRFTVTGAMVNQVTAVNYTVSSSESLLVAEEFSGKVAVGDTVTLNKYVAIVTSRDVGDSEQRVQARQLVEAAAHKGFDQLLVENTEAWATRWNKADVKIQGDDEAQQGLRFNLYGLFSTYYGEDSRLNVGPKGFTGEKYGGATYWDTEAFILPMYLSVADPEISRNLLVYRHNQLDGAVHNAQMQGLKGALYPMVTFTGVECHNEWEITFEEIHRNGAMVHAIYNYTNYTGDESYVLNEGVDVLVAISRFWADRVHYSKRNDRYMIHGVTGPNEYENNINNNYHTNRMATWTLEYTLDTLAKLSHEKAAELAVSDEERQQWQDIIEKMYYPYDDELGIFVQHDTFLDKDLTPVAELDPENRPLNQNWSWDKILRSPYIKQADVLQSIYFLNDRYTQEEKQANFDFYEPLTVHESSLSPSIHAVLAAELGMEDKAVELYSRTARLDLDNYNNDTEDGLHITSMSGAWLAIVQGFAGMRIVDGRLSFKPFLPKQWDSYDFKINFRDRLLDVHVAKDGLSLSLEEGESIDVLLWDDVVTLSDSIKQPLK